MTTYVDAGWTGTPAAVSAALASFGFQVNTDSTVSTIDPTKAGSVVAVTGYRELDGVAYVLIRSTAVIPLPAGVTAIGTGLTAALSGVFMSGTTTPTTIPAVAFFNRFTQAETAAIWSAAIANPAIGVGLMNGLAAGSVDLASPTVKTWLDGLVAAGALTAARETVVLTP